LQQEKQDEARKARRSARLAGQEPLAAPQPTRAKPSAGMWKEGMDIRFGSNNDPNKENEGKNSPDPRGKGKKGWDQSQGINFGT
jgi:hypothetical protein